MYYSSRIKQEYIRRYAIAWKAYDDASEEDRKSGTVKKPFAVQLRAEVGKEFWLLETAELRAEVTQDNKDAHLKEIEEWEQSREVPQTAQQFHQ